MREILGNLAARGEKAEEEEEEEEEAKRKKKTRKVRRSNFSLTLRDRIKRNEMCLWGRKLPL